MAVIGKRAVHCHESCRTYANIEPYRRTSYRYGSFFHMKGMIMDDETTEERDTAERDDLTPNEAHRAGEFDDLRDMLTSITDKLNDALERIGAIDERIDGIYDKFADSVAQMVENGATVKENDDDAAEAIAQAAAEDLENLDYTL
ncbi:MAG: hypothetical protein [Bacteriophage sp.]|nr:MAG: hypothetical protein [Bacteriophage sp.]